MWKLYQGSYAQRDIHVRENKSTIFPMKFCPILCVEKLAFAEQAINTWLSVLKVLKYYEGLQVKDLRANLMRLVILFSC